VSREAALAATVAAGGLIACQAPVNAALARTTTGTFGAATVNFIVGLVLLLIVTFIFAGGFSPAEAGEPTRWYYFLGGLMGATYVLAALISVKHLGAGGVTAATISGQLVLSMVLDRMGVLGLEERPLSAARLIGVAFLAVGVFLILRD
jgi:transporter family-2 protein